jgi:hypothetical protein
VVKIRSHEPFSYYLISSAHQDTDGRNFVLHQNSGAAPWPMTRGSRTRSVIHQTLNGFFLRDLGEERNSFCTLTMVEMDHRKLVMGRRLGGSAMAVVATSGGGGGGRDSSSEL